MALLSWSVLFAQAPAFASRSPCCFCNSTLARRITSLVCSSIIAPAEMLCAELKFPAAVEVSALLAIGAA